MNTIPSSGSIDTVTSSRTLGGLKRSQQAWSVPFRQSDACVRSLPIDIALRGLDETAEIRLIVGGRLVNLLTQHSTLCLIVERLEPLVRWAQLSPTAKANVLEYLFADVLKTIEDTAGMSINLEEVLQSKASLADVNYAFEVKWDGLTFALCGEFPTELLPRLIRWTRRLPARSLSALVTSISLRRGYALLTAGEIASLAPGDAVLVESEAAGRFVAVAGERFLASCTRTDIGLALTEPMHTCPTSPMRHFMTNETLDAELQGPPQPSSVADIPIKLVFEAGRLEMPLRELEKLSEGHIFPLERSAGELVDIIAQGRIIGQGEIVALEGFAAVRITAITN